MWLLWWIRNLFITVYRWLKRFSTAILDASDDQNSEKPIEVTDKFHPLRKKRLFVRLSLLTMTNPNQLCHVIILCVLRWLMRPILALNCLLQIEQERSEEESSVGDALALAFRCARFCSASLILFASYSPAPLFMRPRHFVRSCAICSHDSVGMLKSLREALRVSLYRFFWPPWERFSTWSSP